MPYTGKTQELQQPSPTFVPVQRRSNLRADLLYLRADLLFLRVESTPSHSLNKK